MESTQNKPLSNEISAMTESESGKRALGYREEEIDSMKIGIKLEPRLTIASHTVVFPPPDPPATPIINGSYNIFSITIFSKM